MWDVMWEYFPPCIIITSSIMMTPQKKQGKCISCSIVCFSIFEASALSEMKGLDDMWCSKFVADVNNTFATEHGSWE